MAIAVAALLALAGCGNGQRDATEAAINAAQGAVQSVKPEAEKYVPEQVEAAEKTLQSAREALAKKDYEQALTAAQDAANRARAMASAAVTKKEEWVRTWKELDETVPKALEQVNFRLNAYSHGARMPEDMDQDALEQAKAEYAKTKETWEKAKGAETQGNLREAVEKGTAVQEAVPKLREMARIKTPREGGK